MPNSVTPTAHQKKLVRLGALFFLAAWCLASCEKKKVAPETEKLKVQMEAAQKQLIDADVEVKSSKDDPVAAAAAIEEKELLKSRLERIKAQLRAAGELEPEPAAPAEGQKSAH